MKIVQIAKRFNVDIKKLFKFLYRNYRINPCNDIIELSGIDFRKIREK